MEPSSVEDGNPRNNHQGGEAQFRLQWSRPQLRTETWECARQIADAEGHFNGAVLS